MRLGDYLLARDLLIHIYYSDGSWGRPQAHSAAYVRVRHLFPHTTASSCTLQELEFILLHNAVLIHLILFHCFFRTRPFFLSFVFTFFIISSLFCLSFIYSRHYRPLPAFYLREHWTVSVPDLGETVWMFTLKFSSNRYRMRDLSKYSIKPKVHKNAYIPRFSEYSYRLN